MELGEGGWDWVKAVWTTVSGATLPSYTPVAADDAGKRLRAVVSYDDGTGKGRSATSTASGRVDRRGVVTLSTTVPDVGVGVVATLADPDVWRDWERRGSGRVR